jgi:hypothetical protein
MIDSIEKTNNVSEMTLRGLSNGEVHEMVCDLLRIDSSSESYWPLSEFLWQVTNGSELGYVDFYQLSFTMLMYAIT